MKTHFPLRTALIGISGYGRTHLSNIRTLERDKLLLLKAATVINRHEMEEECRELEASGCRVYTDYREMLEAESADLDVCCIPTGIAWHARMTTDALAHGLHVLVEKPAAATLQEVESMRVAAHDSGRIVGVGFQDIYSPAAWCAKEHLLGESVGRILSVDVHGAWPRPDLYYQRNDWAGRLGDSNQWILDSPANNAMSHFIMLALFFAGKTLASCASLSRLEGELYRAQCIESFDTLSVRAWTSDDIPILINMTHSSGRPIEPVIRVRGDKGTLVWSHRRDVCLHRSGECRQLARIPVDAQKACLLRTFAGRISHGEGTICTLDMATEHTRLINALHEFVPVYSIDEEFLDFLTSGNGVQTAIRNIESDLDYVTDQQSLFSEAEIPWAMAATHANLGSYRRFEGICDYRCV